VTSASDDPVLAQWIAWAAEHPGRLPPGVEPVQTRLIRAVGRGVLASGRPAFVKVMGFPRPRDRLRYWLRPLPAPHEAAMLAAARAAGIPCPEVLAVVQRRDRFGAPCASMLVTAGLDVLPDVVPRLYGCSALAARLADAGIAHPDLHAANFVQLRDGGCAVLDLQSARRRARPLRRAARLRMAARLLASDWPEPELPGDTVIAGLIRAEDLPRALHRAAAMRARALRGRVLRCLRESTEFTVLRRPWGVLIQRRNLAPGGVWRAGGRELIRVWIGARFCEVADGQRSPLGALFRKSWWFPGRSSVYIAGANGVAWFEERRARWLDAYGRFMKMSGGGRRGSTLPSEAPLPWSGLREV